jgi:hypothetical protein
VFSTSTEAQSASGAEQIATAIVMVSTACVTTSDALQEQPAVDVAVDTSISDSFAGQMITQANRVGCGFNAITEERSASCAAENATEATVEATTANDEVKSPTVATQARVDAAKLDVAPGETHKGHKTRF